MVLRVQPIQLRLGFATPDDPVVLALSLSGLRVLVETTDPPLAWSYLSGAGVNPTMGDGRGLAFPAAHLPALADLPPQVSVSADRTLRTLLLLVQHPVDGDVPAELSSEPDGSLWLRWFDGVFEHVEPVPAAAAGVLLTADLPFVATPAAFDVLRAASALPVLLGRAQVNHDGFIEISTSKPQLVELSPLPGLFRLDDTRFGLALAHADAIEEVPGFAWASRRPVLERGPSILSALPMELSRHAASDLRRMVDQLAAFRAQAVVWGSGLGRRVFALAAVDTLDAWPVLVVCTPATVWAWQRHLEMFGRSTSLTHDDADAQLVTYDELAAKRPRTSPQTIIYDSIGSPGVLTPATLAALRRLDSTPDAYRLAISAEWPTDPEQVLNVMSVLRPAEFRPGIPLGTRYPGNAQERLTAHVRSYICARGTNAPGNDTRPFRRSTVVQVAATQAQREAIDIALRKHGATSPAALLVEALEIASCGPPLSLSPKIAAVVARAQEALRAGHRVALVTRHRRTATLLRSLIRVPDAVTVEATVARESGVPHVRLAVVRFDRELPDLRWFDDVLVVDLPWSWASLDAAVGSPVTEDGPAAVTVFHLRGSVDDRLAMLAARRKQLGTVIDQSRAPDGMEMNYLLEVVRAP